MPRANHMALTYLIQTIEVWEKTNNKLMILIQVFLKLKI